MVVLRCEFGESVGVFLFAYLLFEDVFFFYVVLIFILRSGNDVVTEWYRSGIGNSGYLLTLHKVGFARRKIFQSKLCVFYSLALPLHKVGFTSA